MVTQGLFLVYNVIAVVAGCWMVNSYLDRYYDESRTSDLTVVSTSVFPPDHLTNQFAIRFTLASGSFPGGPFNETAYCRPYPGPSPPCVIVQRDSALHEGCFYPPSLTKTRRVVLQYEMGVNLTQWSGGSVVWLQVAPVSRESCEHPKLSNSHANLDPTTFVEISKGMSVHLWMGSSWTHHPDGDIESHFSTSLVSSRTAQDPRDDFISVTVSSDHINWNSEVNLQTLAYRLTDLFTDTTVLFLCWILTFLLLFPENACEGQRSFVCAGWFDACPCRNRPSQHHIPIDM